MENFNLSKKNFKKENNNKKLSHKSIYKNRKLKAWAFILTSALCAYSLSLLAPIKTLAISPLIIAVVLGAILSNTFYEASLFLEKTGVIKIATKQILRLGIVLYGFKITLNDIGHVGFSGVLMAFFIVFSTFFIGYFLGLVLGLDKKSSVLISAGSSICGAAAVLATSSVIKAKSDKVGVAVCTVVVFGTIFMFLYPVLFRLGVLDLSKTQMGYLMGLSLHEVAHAVGAGAAVGGQASDLSVIIKMLRVLMLVPFLFMMSFFIFDENNNKKSTKKVTIPWFGLWFLAMVFIGSFLPLNLRDISLPIVNFIDIILLTIAMFALGITIRKDMLKKSGKKPFILATFLAIWLFTICFVIAKFLV
ncbi:YeiH family protein [Campylobacter ureolyticus]|uniref:YeiH family protein n=1 Tax=Campylobacter ureolyticus TaxID=827 RepID=UPI0022B40D9B|nr:putative sulfate exporter family transporter [Campylobacter ureolyticus]MCZ6111518.1 putative sulfate exporter family transporter [Campylobacter ureolyticus]MDK8323317.1 putative sulfate exporter family transporter [Campylobacter ureolyticus]